MNRIGDLVRRLRGLLGDEKGVVAPAFAVLGVLLVAAAGLALDVGLYYTNNRQLRVATEAAALAAAGNPNDATNQATTYLAKNGFGASALKSIKVEVGYYCANSVKYAAGSRFIIGSNTVDCPGSSAQNAVRVTTTKQSQRFLSAVLGSSLIPDLTATASAARIDEAGIAVTSGILTITNSLVTTVNNLLGALLNIKLTLSTAQIEALMGGNVDVGKFLDNLATRTSQTSTNTYNMMMQGTYSLQIIAYAAADAAYDTNTANALKAVGNATAGFQVPMSKLFSLGVWKNMPVNTPGGNASNAPGPTLRASLNAYQLIAFAAQTGPSALDLSGLVSTVISGSTVSLAGIYNGPTSRPRFAFGPAAHNGVVETEVATSALRLKLNLGIGNVDLGLLSLLGQPVKPLSVIVDVAPATAQLSSITCNNEQDTDTKVTVQATSGLAYAYIGTAPDSVLTSSQIQSSQIQQVNLINVLGVLTVDARAVAGPVLGNSGPLVFGTSGTSGVIGTPTRAAKPLTIGNGAQVGALLTSLPASLTAQNGLQINLLGLCIWPLCTATTQQNQQNEVRQKLIGAITTPISNLVSSTVDPLLDNVLAALGVQLGHATVWVNGARCGVPVLI